MANWQQAKEYAPEFHTEGIKTPYVTSADCFTFFQILRILLMQSALDPWMHELQTPL